MPAAAALVIGAGPPRLVGAASSGTTLADACGNQNQRNWLCTTTYRITGSKDAAEAADALSKPLRIVIVILLAYLAVRILNRGPSRVPTRCCGARSGPRRSARCCAT
jgi:hypothetical protein